MREHRATATAAMDQVILRLVGDIASGRAEENRSFAQKNHVVNFLCKRKRNTMLPQAKLTFGSVIRPKEAAPRNAC
ncbi:MAG: hypothetical protein ACLFVO_23555 [Chloroflexaceae bacterium]